MAKIDDGGTMAPQWVYDKNGVPIQTEGGLTLRDAFAGQALMGMSTWVPSLPNGNYPIDPETVVKLKAEWAYLQADAMIAARKANNG